MRRIDVREASDGESANECGIEKWCHFTETIQDFPDVCLVTTGVYPPEPDSCADTCEVNFDDDSYKYYGWYKITYKATGSDTEKSVCRRLRKATSREGYPNNCIVMDPYTSNELGLNAFNVYKESEFDRRKHLTHYRSKRFNIAETSFPYDDCDGIDNFVEAKRKSRERKYIITGFPVYPLHYQSHQGEIKLERISNETLRSEVWWMFKHPDYAVNLACRIARISVVIAIVSFAFGFISLILALVSGADTSVRLNGIEQQLAALQDSI